MERTLKHLIQISFLNSIIFRLGNEALQFAGDNIEEYGVAYGMEKSLKTISACFWINTPASYQHTHQPNIISYSIFGNKDFLVCMRGNVLEVHRLEVAFKYVINCFYIMKLLS